MAAHCTLLISLCLIINVFLHYLKSENILGEETEDFDFDGLPGAMHEFKIEITSGDTECFYQQMSRGAELHMSFEVLRGADRNVDVIIKNPDGVTVDSHLWKPEGHTEKAIELEGTYEICIDNSFSRFSSKLVYIYLITYKQSDWQRYTEELQQLDVSIDNFTNSLQNVDKSIKDMQKLQGVSRQYIILDWYLVHGNNRYVQNLSMVMIVIILLTAGLQTYFVRKLFVVKHVTPTEKPRA